MKLAMYLKEKQEHSSVDGAQSPASPRLQPTLAVATPSCTTGSDSNLLLLLPDFHLSSPHIAPYASV